MAGKKPKAKTSAEVIPYINPARPVFVYRNLNFKCLSVMQDGIVRCHVDNIVLEDAEFRVGKAGQRRVRIEKSKNVHAKVKGMVVANPVEILQLGWQPAYYNPYKTDEFTDVESGRHLKSAKYCDIDTQEGMLTVGQVFFPAH